MKQVTRLDLKEHIWKDQRGWGINPLEIADMVGQAPGDIHLVSLEPGAVRGNHYHPGTTEWLVFYDSDIDLYWQRNEGEPIHEIRIGKDEIAVFEVAPGVRHAVLNSSVRTIYILSFSSPGQRETIRVTYPLVSAP